MSKDYKPQDGLKEGYKVIRVKQPFMNNENSPVPCWVMMLQTENYHEAKKYVDDYTGNGYEFIIQPTFWK